MQNKHHAIGIISGGLDSLLAIKVIQHLNIQVTALHFVIGFEPGHLRFWMEHPDQPAVPPEAIEATGAKVLVMDIRKDIMQLLTAPPHGFGSHCNPCIDCHALMLQKAKRTMETHRANFVFSGEVLGQRPMSQNKQALDLVAKTSGLGGRLVRPLSGALLEPTIPEQEGLFAHDDLLDIQGRSRKRQLALANELGLHDFPAPAGGCLLTDPQFSIRLKDLFTRRSHRLLHPDDPILLFVGRHIVLPGGGKVVIGREEKENLVIERFAHAGLLLRAVDVPGPSSLVEGPCEEQDIVAAAELTARYGKGRTQAQVQIEILSPHGPVRSMQVKPNKATGCKILH